MQRAFLATIFRLFIAFICLTNWANSAKAEPGIDIRYIPWGASKVGIVRFSADAGDGGKVQRNALAATAPDFADTVMPGVPSLQWVICGNSSYSLDISPANGVIYTGVVVPGLCSDGGYSVYYKWTSNNRGLRSDAYTIEFAFYINDTPFYVTYSVGINLFQERNIGECKCSGEGNPIDAASGNKFQAETDFTGSESIGLSLTRYYNSSSVDDSNFGRGWSTKWHRRLQTSGPGYPITAIEEDGRRDNFSRNNSTGAYEASPDVRSRLSLLKDANNSATGWKLITVDDSSEFYDLSGKLLSIVMRNGRKTTLTYDANGSLSEVKGPFGHKIAFSYDAAKRVSRMTASDGAVYLYAYDSRGNLTSVTYPGGAVRRYVYENAAYPNSLTGIIDELGNRFATYGYNAEGLAVSSEHADGADLTRLAFGATGTTTVTDPRGNTHVYGFRTQFGMVKPAVLTGAPVQKAGGKAFSYDANGFLARLTDWNDNITTFVHDARGNETSRVEASGTPLARTIATSWHPTLHVPTKVTEPGRVTTFTRDANGNVLTKAVTAGALTRTFSYTYNAAGQVLTATDALGNVTTYTYDLKGNLASVTNALGHVTRFTNYDGAGRLLRSVDPNGLVTALTYDARGRLLTRTVGARITAYVYDLAGNLTKVTQPDGSFLAFSYDKAHRLTGIADALGNRVVYTLDAAGNRIREQAFNAANVQKRTRSFAYDPVNRLIRTIGALGQTTSYGYDKQGNLTSTSDPLAHRTTHAYDALNRLVQSADAAGGATARAYDALDHLTSVTDPRGLKTSYTWTALDDERAISSPDTGGTIRTFDAAGNVLTSTDTRGKRTTYAYDALNRKTSETYADGTSVVWQYDQGANGKGHVTGISDATGSTSYLYSLYGQLIRKQQITGAVTRTTWFAYDASGRLSAMTYPSGKKVSYAYDVAGQVSGLTIDAQPIVSGVTYAPFGGVTGWTFGNGGTYRRTIDQDNRIAGLGFPGRSILLAYDAASRIKGMTDNARPAKTFGYDALDRLTSYAGGSVSQSYGYDADGNRTTASFTDGATTNAFTYAYVAGRNRLSGLGGAWNETFAYDGVGNTTRHDSPAANLAFTYDAKNRMAQSKVGALARTYGVNGLGQRVVKANPASTTDKTHFVYDEEGHLLGEYGVTGARLEETVWLGDLPVATLQPTGTFYIAPDHLGAPSQITNAAKQVVWLWDHDPFGNGAPTGSVVYNLRFPGQYYDAETGLNYNYYRDYDPKLGRYVQSDPIGLESGINTYGYVEGNPLTNTDKFGLDKDDKYKRNVVLSKSQSLAELDSVLHIQQKNINKIYNSIKGGEVAGYLLDNSSSIGGAISSSGAAATGSAKHILFEIISGVVQGVGDRIGQSFMPTAPSAATVLSNPAIFGATTDAKYCAVFKDCGCR
jgi:RHS repeat-associated protein